MISQDILKDAQNLIGDDRQKDYGDKVTNHTNIAALWSIFLRKEVTPHDAAVCMALVKVARLMHQHKKDSYIDMAAYAAIAGEIEARSETKDQSFESEGERRGRIGEERIKSLNKKNDPFERNKAYIEHREEFPYYPDKNKTPSEELQDELEPIPCPHN